MPIVRAGSDFRMGRHPINRHLVDSMRQSRRAHRATRGMGAAYLQDPCDCFYSIPGVPDSVTNPNNKPKCDPVTGLAPGCTIDEPPCGGIAFGQPGYAECVQSQTTGPLAALIAKNSAAAGIDYSAASDYAPLLAAAKAAAPKASPPAGTPTPKPAAQSNAPNPARVTTKTSTPAAAQSNAPNAATAPAILAPASGGFLTGTLLGFPTWAVLGVAAIGGIALFSGGRH